MLMKADTLQQVTPCTNGRQKIAIAVNADARSQHGLIGLEDVEWNDNELLANAVGKMARVVSGDRDENQ